MGSGFSMLSASPWENKYSRYTSSSILSKLHTEEDGLLLRYPAYPASVSSPEELSLWSVYCSRSKLEHSGRKSSMAANVLPHSGSMSFFLLLSIRPITNLFDVSTCAWALSILFFSATNQCIWVLPSTMCVVWWSTWCSINNIVVCLNNDVYLLGSLICQAGENWMTLLSLPVCKCIRDDLAYNVLWMKEK